MFALRSRYAAGTATALALAAPIGCGDDDSLTPIEAYCSYGTVSIAQLAHCLATVTADDYETRDTEAARYAKGERATCGPEAGAYCGDKAAVDKARRSAEYREDTQGR
jgi:hypothetical protein